MRSQNLRHAHRQLLSRTPDECFDTIQQLYYHCQMQQRQSIDSWQLPQSLVPHAAENRLLVNVGSDGACLLNDWSFSQLCSLAHVSKDTVNRLSSETAVKVFQETLPVGNRPLQVLTQGDRIRSVHGVSYTRLWNLDLLEVIAEFAPDFHPPQRAAAGGTGLYAGEQDLFCFLVDSTCWVEIEGQAFAPGFFIWNSEVGRRSVGISTFWFQAVCANHIIWDAIEVQSVTRKHTASVHEALSQIRANILHLVEQRDRRRDSFHHLMRKAMATRLGQDADEVLQVLCKAGMRRRLAKEAVEHAGRRGTLTIFAVLDALTQLAREIPNAGERLEADQKAASLLALAGH